MSIFATTHTWRNNISNSCRRFAAPDQNRLQSECQRVSPQPVHRNLPQFRRTTPLRRRSNRSRYSLSSNVRSAVSYGFVPPSGVAARRRFRNGSNRSIGIGKIVVELRSAAISFSVCR